MSAREERPVGTARTHFAWAARRPVALLVRAALAALIVLGAIASCIDWGRP